MNDVSVRCWDMPAGNDKIVITYPEDNAGYGLGICLKCGVIYAVDVAKEVYIGPPLFEKLKALSCQGCGSDLSLTWASYPETYRTAAGTVASFCRPMEIPDARLSRVCAFPSIY